MGYCSEKINSIKFSPDRPLLCIGFERGQMGIKDINKGNSIPKLFQRHTERITALDWQQDMILSGSKDQTTYIQDVRTEK